MIMEEMNAHSIENCPVQKQFLELEEEHNELQKSVQLSAMYGKTLLEENLALKHQMKELRSIQEQSVQENHNLKMQLEVSKKLQFSQSQEMEAMKESVLKAEEMNQKLKSQEEEKQRKETNLETEIACIKDQELVLKEQHGLAIKELESEIHLLKTKEKPAVLMPCDHEEEMNQLQIQLEISKECSGKLEGSVLLCQNQIQQLQFAERKLQSSISEMEYEVLAKDKALASMEKLMEEKRMEVLELQALLEAERVSQTNPEKRGNSIFSEVEDRRQQVERHLSKLTVLLDKEKRKNQDLQSEIVKVKNQMAYVAFGGNNADQGKNTEHIENLLRSSNAQNKELLKKIEQLEKKTSCGSFAPPQLEDSRKWMQAMLAQKQEENDKLRGEIRDHIRSFLCQNDQTMQLTKRLNDAEKQLQRARSEVVRLKISIDEMALKENVQTPSPIYARQPHRVTEDLKHMMESKEESPQMDRLLKERIVHQNQESSPPPSPPPPSSAPPPPPPPADDDVVNSSTVVDHNTSSTISVSIKEVDACKRQVRMNSEVHVVYDDGDTTLETLAEDKFTAGAKKVVKPVGRQVDVEDAASASAAMECNQQ